MSEVTNELRFRTSAAIAARLGAEQLKDEVTAVVELVKNGYDADATWVKIELDEARHGQVLRISDNGSGMDREDLRDKWCVIATENKVKEDRSPRYRRRRLGQKGIGRFAAHKLGHLLVMRTRPRDLRPGKVLEIQFAWDRLDAASDQELHTVPFELKLKSLKPFEPQPSGSTLKILQLRENWTKKRMEKLRDQLSYLIDPESGVQDFRIRLMTPWKELNGELANPLLGEETHSLTFQIDENGCEEVRYRSGTEEEKAAELVGADRLGFGPVSGALRYFAGGLSAKTRSRGGRISQDWNMGVRLFRDGFRVRPYGEPGREGDWLQIFQSRFQMGSRLRLNPRYLQGSIHISADLNPALKDTSSREGLSENDAFHALTEYLKRLIVRLNEGIKHEELREQRRQKDRRYRTALQPLTQALNNLQSDFYRDSVEKHNRRAQRELARRSNASVSPANSSDIRNAHWECLDCGDAWKVPKELVPGRCREHSVRRDGSPSLKPGCGSTNIRKKGKESRPQVAPTRPAVDKAVMEEDELNFLRGAEAYVSGVQLRPCIDWDMGEKDDEAEVRVEERSLAINGNHAAFVVADRLDRKKLDKSEDELDALQKTAALQTHVVNAAALAWARWHYDATTDFEDFLERIDDFKRTCLMAFT